MHFWCSEDEKVKFVEKLEDQVGEDNMMIIWDLIAQTGIVRNGYEEVMGAFGYGKRNVEGEEILNPCTRNKLLGKNILFKKRDSHKVTRCGWDGKSKTVITYVLTDKLIGGKVRNTKVTIKWVSE
ncbi:uncharacterized protein LOC124789095 [Schistocerca piceifrons]|uniref:uncharacterized protein LOC124789095 n=1 Tax=Schistocerca piceifrons TaxID=274613 RepID=UPI001F5F04D8|nr:uncharacterized protein LOC124789095 [Schistocerca piceifrons]